MPGETTERAQERAQPADVARATRVIEGLEQLLERVALAADFTRATRVIEGGR